MKTVHGVPAILSFLFPGLGQLCKDQLNRAALIWLAMFTPWVLWGLAAALYIPEVMGAMMYGDASAKVSMMVRVFLSSAVFPFIALLNLTVHLWSVVDAYRTPTQ